MGAGRGGAEMRYTRNRVGTGLAIAMAGAITASLVNGCQGGGGSTGAGALGSATPGAETGGASGTGASASPTPPSVDAGASVGGGSGDASVGVVDGGSPPRPTTSIAGCAPITPPTGTVFTGIWIGPAGEVWVAGTQGIVGRRLPDSQGGTWSYCRPGSDLPLRAISGVDSNNVWVVGNVDVLMHWNGSAWAVGPEPPFAGPRPPDLNDVQAVTTGSGFAVWVVGDAGVARMFDGTTWQVADADARYTLTGVWVSPSGVVRASGFAALPILVGIPGQEAVVLRRTVGGAWTREGVVQEERGAGQFLRISGAADDDIWAVGTKYPSGAAAAFAMAAHFDGTTWSVLAGTTCRPAHPGTTSSTRSIRTSPSRRPICRRGPGSRPPVRQRYASMGRPGRRSGVTCSPSTRGTARCGPPVVSPTPCCAGPEAPG